MDLIANQDVKKELVCRTCLNESNNLKPFFMDDGNEIFKMLQCCSDLNILSMVGFSNYICSVCLNKAQISYDFQQQCEISHNTFINFMRDHPDETYEAKMKNSNRVHIINGGSACKGLMNTVCRTCLNESINMKPLFVDNENNIYEMLQFCCGLKIHAMDGSPTNICSDCLNKLNIFYEFRKQCEIFVNLNQSKICGELNWNIKKCTSSFEIYDCGMCPNRYSTLSQLQEHFKNDHQSNECEIKLELSDNLISDAVDLVMDCVEEKYKISEAGEYDHNDPNDGHQSDKDEKISLHHKIKSNDSDVQNVPSIILNDKKSNIRRRLNLTVPKPESCKICRKSFSTPRNLLLHIKLGHPTDVIRQLGNVNIPEGVKVEDTPVPLTCTVCNLTFDIKYIYYQHMQSEHKNIKLFQCNQCNSKFAQMNQLRRHEKTHVNIKSFSCEQCGLCFSQEYNKRRHMRTHLNITPYKCEQCDKTYTRADKLRMHLQNQHNVEVIKMHQCNQCDRNFFHLKQLERHLKSHLDMGSNPCEECGMVFVTKFNKIRHMQTHSNIDPYRCDECDMGFKRKDGLHMHKVNRHGEKSDTKSMPIKPEICEICEKAFTTPGYLKAHMQLGHLAVKTGSFLCSECGLLFSHHSKLIYHMRQHSGEKPYKCTVCNKRFARTGDLNKHVRCHTKDRKYLCTLCNRGFYCANHLRVHTKRLHSRERPYKCPHCDKSYIQRYELANHIQRHAGKLLKCNICGDFVDESLITQHKYENHQTIEKTDVIDKFISWFVRLITNKHEEHLNKKYNCTICGKGFPRAYSLKRHSKCHTGERPHNCTQCDKSFPERYDLRKHMKRVHTQNEI